MSMDEATRILDAVIGENGRVTVLTGAGISAESGIPTFRGAEGFWTIGSKNYQPQEMATVAMFSRHPEPVWAWYLYRMGLCRRARPNPGHLAIAAMERHLLDQFTLITQNVDNLHIVAGNSPARTFQIHGNIFKVRCASACTDEVFPLPADLTPKDRETVLSPAERRLLTCPRCGGWLRPHVLWFDETYNERHYRFDSAIETAMRTRLLITVGTAGATNLPNQIAHLVYRNKGLLIDLNVADNPFASLAMQSDQGVFVQGPSSASLSVLARRIVASK